MTTLYEQIKQTREDALRSKDSFTFTKLGTVLGEAKQLATKKENRDPTDEEVVSIVKKGLEGIGEMLEHEFDNSKRSALLFERDLLQKYMPIQLSAPQIEVIIHNSALDNLGKIMALFKLNYTGKYDGKVVKAAAEAYIASLK